MQNLTSLSNVKLKSGETLEGAEPKVVNPATSLLEHRHPKEPSENAILLSKGINVPCVVNGEVVNVLIQPFKFADLENVLDAVAPIYSKMENLAQSREEVFNMVKDSKKLLEFIKKYKPSILKFMVAFNGKLTPSFVNELDIGTVAELLLTIVTVNVDFFIQEASPKLIEGMRRLAVDIIPKLGNQAKV